MHPFIEALLATLDVASAGGSAITLDDFSEDELKHRYGKLFGTNTRTVFMITGTFKVIKVADWEEFMAAQAKSTSDIDAVIAVPHALAAQIETTLAEAA